MAAPRRLASQCLQCRLASLSIRPARQHRQFTSSNPKDTDRSSRDGDQTLPPNPVLEEYRRKNPEPQRKAAAPSTVIPKPGDLGASSIFEDDRRAQLHKEADDAPTTTPENVQTGTESRDPRNMLRVLDPDPNARERWERKQVIKAIRRGGRLKKAEFIRRTEREHLAKSHNLKTSVKKLGMLARQIAGKSVDDAITQMRFSKKKIAVEVCKHLEAARDEAVVMRGMGLGGVSPAPGAENLSSTSVAVSGTTSVDAAARPLQQSVEIQLKDGKRHLVTDPSKIYIDQAWVGRGPYGKLPDYRARGRIFIMHTPWTSISFVLKEEATRIREYEDREAKRTRQRIGKLWVPLPDRPVTNMRQWYSW